MNSRGLSPERRPQYELQALRDRDPAAWLRDKAERRVTLDTRGSQNAAAVLRVCDLADQHIDALRRIAYKANQLSEDGLMARGTGCQIRDMALTALGAHGDEAIRVIRGDYEKEVN